MNIAKELKSLIRERLGIKTLQDKNMEAELDDCLLRTADAMMKDVDETIRIIQEECSGDECAFLADLLIEVTYRTKDRRFIDCFASLEEKHMNEYYGYFIYEDVAAAEEVLKEINSVK